MPRHSTNIFLKLEHELHIYYLLVYFLDVQHAEFLTR